MNPAAQVLPTEANFPHRPGARAARLVAGSGGVRLPRGDRTVAEYRRGEHGPVDAVRLAGLPPFSARSQGPLGSSAVVLRDRAARPLALIPVAEWLPESSAVLDADAAWQRSGLPHLLGTAGLPVRTVHGYSERDGLTPQLLAGIRVLVPSPGRSLPVQAARIVLLLAWMVPMVGVPASGGRRGWLAALEVLLALIVGLDLALLGRDRWQDRRSRRGTVLYRPAPGQDVTRAFAGQAALRRSADALGLVSAEGSERWLPLTGPGRIAALGLVGPEGADPLAVAFLDDHDRARAALPWRSWFAARPNAVGKLAADLGVPVRADGRPLGLLSGDLQHYDGGRRPVWPNGSPFDQPYDPTLFAVVITELAAAASGSRPDQLLPALAVAATFGRYAVRYLLRARWSGRAAPVGEVRG